VLRVYLLFSFTLILIYSGATFMILHILHQIAALVLYRFSFVFL
jgi:hypothetical protein